MITITVRNNLKKKEDLFDEKKVVLNDAIHDAGFLVENAVKQDIASYPSVDTGAFLGSVQTDASVPFEARVFTPVEYACLIGSRNQIYNPQNGLSQNIGNLKFSKVLSKDGKQHNILKRLRFSTIGKKEINGIKIYASRKSSLTVTYKHMILILRNGNLEWTFAEDLNYDDYVFRKRTHNEIIDNSNKQKFICICGNEFFVLKSILKFRKIKYCSIKCRHKYGKHNFSLDKKWFLTEEQKRYGKNNPAWENGSSFIPYDWRFNEFLKEQIKDRDNYTCQYCKRDKENGNVPYLIVHHKDWNKKNSNKSNLITLCPSCHGKQKRVDCSLPEVNLSIFKPVKIKKLERVIFKRVKNESLPWTYDLTIKDEDSFVAGGIIIHNSYLEFGTSPHFISPRTAQALAWEVNGKWFFSKGHMVRGIAPRRHFGRTAMNMKSAVIDFIESRLKSVK